MVVYNNGTDLYGVSSYIVDATLGQGNYTTIAAALTAASGAGFAGDIFIRPGTYTENPSLVAGVNLVAWPSDGTGGTVIIKGNCTLSTAGTVTISGCQLQTNSAACVTVSGSVASILNLVNCYINCTNNTGITFSSSSASSKLNINFCTGDLGTTGIGLFTNSSAGAFTISNSTFTNSGASLTDSTHSGSGLLFTQYVNLNHRLTTSGSSALISLTYTNIGNGTSGIALTHGSTAANSGCFMCRLYGGSSAAISISASCTLGVTNCEINSIATNAITGAGTINYQGLAFTAASRTINTTTQSQAGTLFGSTTTAPTAGMLGELIGGSYSTAIGTAVAQMATISLTAGVWMVTGNIGINGAANTSLTAIISATTASLTPLQGGASAQTTTSATLGSNICFPSFRVTPTTTTSYFLNASVGASTNTATGIFYAIRVA